VTVRLELALPLLDPGLRRDDDLRVRGSARNGGANPL